MNLSKIFDYVIPCGGVLYKHCNKACGFYKSDEDFIAGKPYHSQDPDSSFEEFLQKLIDKLIWEEDVSGDPELLVTTDYAIECALEARNKSSDSLTLEQIRSLQGEVKALKDQATQDYLLALKQKSKIGEEQSAAYNMAYGIVLMKIDNLINLSK